MPAGAAVVAGQAGGSGLGWDPGRRTILMGKALGWDAGLDAAGQMPTSGRTPPALGLTVLMGTVLDLTAREWVAAGDAGVMRTEVRGRALVEAAGLVVVFRAEARGHAASDGSAG
ncbi:MAG: hypothetical protein P8Z79_20685 [Sedimentisphaerales bacterium]